MKNMFLILASFYSMYSFADYKNFLEARKIFAQSDANVERDFRGTTLSCVRYSVQGEEENTALHFGPNYAVRSSSESLNASQYIQSLQALTIGKKLNSNMLYSYLFWHIKDAGRNTYVIEELIWPGHYQKMGVQSEIAPKGAELRAYHICL